MWNLLIGAFFIIGGLSGKMVLVGTNSSGALVVIGIVLCLWGASQMHRT